MITKTHHFDVQIKKSSCKSIFITSFAHGLIKNKLENKNTHCNRGLKTSLGNNNFFINCFIIDVIVLHSKCNFPSFLSSQNPLHLPLKQLLLISIQKMAGLPCILTKHDISGCYMTYLSVY